MTYRFAQFLIALLTILVVHSSAHAQLRVNAEDWMVGMMETLPNHFCQDDQYFMQCFDVTESECQSVSTRQAQRCLDKFADQLPAQLTMPDDGRQWGVDVGRCAGVGYDLQLAERKLAGPRCNASD